MIFTDPQNPRMQVLQYGTNATDATVSASVATVSSGNKFDYATFMVFLKAASATNISAKFAALSIQEADGTSYSDISGAVGTTNSTATSSQFVLPTNNTTTVDKPYALINVDLRGRKKNLRVVMQPPASTNDHHTAVVVAFGQGKQLPNSDTERNCAVSVVV